MHPYECDLASIQDNQATHAWVYSMIAAAPSMDTMPELPALAGSRAHAKDFSMASASIHADSTVGDRAHSLNQTHTHTLPDAL